MNLLEIVLMMSDILSQTPHLTFDNQWRQGLEKCGVPCVWDCPACKWERLNQILKHNFLDQSKKTKHKTKNKRNKNKTPAQKELEFLQSLLPKPKPKATTNEHTNAKT